MSAIDRRQRRRVGTVRFYSILKSRKSGRKVMVPIPVSDITAVERNKRVFFKAKDPDTGQELWKIPKRSERDLVRP